MPDPALPPAADRAAAVLDQASLRRRASAKFGPRAGGLFLTADGLEQATRGTVAARRAARFARVCDHVVDLGCGIGADALAFLDAGLTVDAVERDPATATFAEANLAALHGAALEADPAPDPGGAEEGVAHAALPGALVADIDLGGSHGPDRTARTAGVEDGDDDAEAGRFRVHVGDAQDWWPRLARAGAGVFCDPARRTASGRTWRTEDLSPPWEFALSLLDGARPVCLKLGPGVPHRLLPATAEVEWISDGGTVVECAVWSGPGSIPGRRTAVVDGVELSRTERADVGAPAKSPPPPPPALLGVLAGADLPSAPLAREVGRFVYEPDGAVIRAGLVDDLAGLLRASRLATGIAYLTADWHLPTPFATAFRVVESLPLDEKVLRAWVRERDIGTLEIKKRGIEIDPAELRRRLKPRGRASATLVLTPTANGAKVLVCERVRASG